MATATTSLPVNRSQPSAAIGAATNTPPNGEAPLPSAVQTKYRKYENGTMWYVIYEVIDGMERFVSLEAGETGLYREFTPTWKEREAAREVAAQAKARNEWSTALCFDDMVVNVIATLGQFPECVRSAIHELKALRIDCTNDRHLRITETLSQHASEGEAIVATVYRWFEEHRRLRGQLKTLKINT
jgi:hypothetical protein